MDKNGRDVLLLLLTPLPVPTARFARASFRPLNLYRLTLGLPETYAGIRQNRKKVLLPYGPSG
jgi:hypothetical protein